MDQSRFEDGEGNDEESKLDLYSIAETEEDANMMLL